MSINIQTVGVVQGKKEYKSGYTRDYNRDFSLVGLDLFSDTNRKKIKELNFSADDGWSGLKDFKFNNKNYNYRINTDNGVRLVYEKGTPGEILKQEIEKIKEYNSKKIMKDGLKVNKIDITDSVYISQKIDLTDFCPSFAAFSKPLPYCFLCEVEFDTLKLELDLLQHFDESKKLTIPDFFFIKNGVTWDTFDLFINFMIVEATTRIMDNRKEGNVRDLIISMGEEFKKIKRVFETAKKIALKSIAFVEKFFTSFKSRINTENLYKLMSEYKTLIDAYNRAVEKKNIFPVLTDFIERYEIYDICITVYNFCLNNGKTMYDVLRPFADYFKEFNLKKAENFIKSSKSIGQNIFSLLYTGDENKQLINNIITPTIFLGNLLYDDVSVVERYIKIEDKKIELVKDENQQSIENIVEASNINDKDAINTAIGIFFTEEEDGVKRYIDDSYKPTLEFNQWLESNNIVEKIPKEIFSYLSAVGKNIIMREAFNIPENIKDNVLKYLKELYNSFNNYKNQLLAKKNLIDLSRQEEINKIAMTTTASEIRPIYEDELVTENDMLKLGILPIDIKKLDDKKKKLVNSLRSSGITDDVIRLFDVLDNYDDESQMYEGEITTMQSYTQQRWGPNGKFYEDILKSRGARKIVNPYEETKKSRLNKEFKKRKKRKAIVEKKKEEPKEEKKEKKEKKEEEKEEEKEEKE